MDTLSLSTSSKGGAGGGSRHWLYENTLTVQITVWNLEMCAGNMLLSCKLWYIFDFTEVQQKCSTRTGNLATKLSICLNKGKFLKTSFCKTYKSWIIYITFSAICKKYFSAKMFSVLKLWNEPHPVLLNAEFNFWFWVLLQASKILFKIYCPMY